MATNLAYSLDQERAVEMLQTVTAAHKHFVPSDAPFVTRINGRVYATAEYTLSKLVSAATVIEWFQQAGAGGVMQSTQGNVLSVMWRVG